MGSDNHLIDAQAHPSPREGSIINRSFEFFYRRETATVVERPIMKNCKLCQFSQVCNDLPGICILAQYVAVIALVFSLGYLFISQEIFS
jgi:hypothetical protein